jgi:pimeloyl-ACP methyl ester carboxylesterase
MRVWPVVFAVVLVASGIGLLRRIALREDVDWSEVEVPGRLIDINGYRVHVVEEGAGPPVALIHGFGGHTYSFRYLIPRLARDHRVVAVDLKGYGYSERDARAGLSRTDQIMMLRDLFKQLGITQAVVVGHSMGGMIAQRFAAGFPELVQALVLVATAAGNGRGGPPSFALKLPPQLLKPMLPILSGMAARRILELSFYDRSALTPEVEAEYLRPARIRGSMDGLLASIRDRTRDQSIDLTAVRQPVLVLVGEADRIIPRTASEELQQAFPQARIAVIERAGHLLLEERPDECFEAISEFLRSLEPIVATRA